MSSQCFTAARGNEKGVRLRACLGRRKEDLKRQNEFQVSFCGGARNEKARIKTPWQSSEKERGLCGGKGYLTKGIAGACIKKALEGAVNREKGQKKTPRPPGGGKTWRNGT